MEAAYAKHKFETPGFHFQLGNDNRSQHFDKKRTDTMTRENNATVENPKNANYIGISVSA